ncbi:MAG: hypothetical protein GY851_28560 [bacterium]|nr:hypothetical protein [bacterium]
MKKITVQVRDDHLELLARAKPVNGLAELIWNALDAEATEVRVEFVENDLGGVESVRIRDNGHGLAYDHALVAFKNLGGSWKREGIPTPQRKRMVHGKYGKGRFRGFAIGNHVEWRTVYDKDGERSSYSIVGRAATLGEFELGEVSASGEPTGMVVEIADIQASMGLLRGTKAEQDVTVLFALYMRQYPDVRIVYDGVPLDPANAEDRRAQIDLGEMVLESGKRVEVEVTVVEWLGPGKRGIVLCDNDGFALHTVKPAILFRGFSYTAYVKCDHFRALEDGGMLQVDEMAPDLRQILKAVRTELRKHFALREAEQGQGTLALWREIGIYPYDGEPADGAEETERRLFDIYATHLNQLHDFAGATSRHKRLILCLLQEIVRTDPTRVARIFDEVITFPDDKEEEVMGLINVS